ncbi:Glucosamine-6-phosphate deaminase 1 [Caloramator mitchellensis]|uniref:Glucosamine-6-phosphate deaminase n=1 Tax=Caloramator mitchellensis TaxID=908809 RepID=A0A0R3JSI8_CALMK|nr:glucosamine-6-phosphate deaminase [Caloramator mitchellensis]KRQ86457.1 Glucosamine-6-phosphate deaminase 1 [Caloramator mitchellensis]
MRILIEENYEAMSKKAALMVAGQILLKPNSVLGLATGSTPLYMYRELVRMHREEDLDFSSITTFNLDEYVGLNQDNINSYHYYMFDNLFNHVNIKKENIFIPDGMAENLYEECKRYEKLIKDRGGIDLQILGIGKNGHIGFNEPDLKFEATTHVVELDDETIKANSRFFSSIDEVPRRAISMGIKTIMHSRKIILLASGEEKAEAVKKAIFGPIIPGLPASVLQLHPDVTIILDREAAMYVENIDNIQ